NVMVGSEQCLEPALLARLCQSEPLLPGDALLALDHQADPHTQPPVAHLPCLSMDSMEAAFFDLDKTVISRSSSLALTRPMYRAGLVTRSALVKGAYAQIIYLLVGADEQKMDRVKEGMLALTRGWEKDQVEEIIREALADV